MKTPILGSSYVARSINAADNRMVNLFPEIVPEGGKEPAFLQRTPGLKNIVTIGEGPIYGMWALNGYLYVVSKNAFYRVDSSYNYVFLGNVSANGPVSMADNGTQIFISCNPSGYIYNTGTGVLAQILDPDFAGSVNVGFIDGYFVYNQPNTQKIWITALYDGASIDPLDFASAEGSPDNVVGLIVDHREIWIFGTNSTEVWYNSGALDFPFTRIQGAFNELGCVAPYSIAKMDNSIFWLGADARGQGIVYRADGYIGKRISTHSIEWQIQSYGTISDAIAYTYQQDGHSFYVLTFPSANVTWVFDAATSVWHQRGTWTVDVFTRHRSNCQVSYNNKILVGDYQNGNIYSFDLNTYTDNGVLQRWVRTWRALPTGENNLRRTSQHNLQLDCESGVGLSGYTKDEEPFNLTTQNGEKLITQNGEYIMAVPVLATQGADPQVMLRWSDDGGHTWSNEHWSSVGRIGQFGRRVMWRRLGMTQKIRDRVYEISGSDPVKMDIMGAELIISPTNA